MREIFESVLAEFSQLTLNKFSEKEQIAIALLGFQDRKILLTVSDFLSVYNRCFSAEEQVEEGFAYPHASNRNKEGWIAYCLLEKENVILTSLSLMEYLKLYIANLCFLLELSPRAVEREYQKEFMVYWDNEAYRRVAQHKIAQINIYATLGNQARELKCLKTSENEKQTGSIVESVDEINSFFKSRKEQIENVVFVPLINSEGILPASQNVEWDKKMLLLLFENPSVDKINEESYKYLWKLTCGAYQKILIIKMKPPEMDEICFSMLLTFKNNEKKPFLEKIRQDLERVIPIKSRWLNVEHLAVRTATSLELSNKNILLIGAGSVGGYLSLQLSKLGLKKLTIADPKSYNYETALRNYIGGCKHFFETNKACALRSKLELDNPWLHVEVCKKNLLYDTNENNSCFLAQFDLIIVATGGSDTQRAFNALFKKIQIHAPVIFNWLDSEGKGQHALVVDYKKRGCFECLFKQQGKEVRSNKKSFADGTEKIHRNGCNGSFTSYGNDVLCRNTTMMLPVIQSTLLGGVEENYIVSVKNDFSTLETSMLISPEIDKSFFEEECSICGSV